MKAPLFGGLKPLFLWVSLWISVADGDLGAAVAARLGDGDLRLVADGSGAWVERGDGERESVTGYSDVLWRRIEPVGSGWIAAGSRSDRSSPGAGERLVLVLSTAAGTRELAEPGSSGAAIRSWPVPVVRADALAGLVWLEGDTPAALAVRSAVWEEDAWAEAVTIAAPGPGTQTALTGTTLPDGRGLVAWSAFDGVADEIRWSVGFGARWTQPAVLHEPNDVPDVIPAVAAVGDRAVAAWSRFDGNDYRLRLAEWNGLEWMELDWQGGRGSLFPSFATRAGSAWILYATTMPKQWNVIELAAGVGVVREAAVDVPADSPLAGRPILHLGDGAPALLWYSGAPPAELIERVGLRWDAE